MICRRPPACRGRAAFSLVEIAVALGLVSFVLMSIMALLLVGMQSNQASAEETRATTLLTALEADLRNTHPSANGGQSLLFGLDLPYEADSQGNYHISSRLGTPPTALVPGSTTIGFNDTLDASGSRLAPLTAEPRPVYQVSVIYTSVPASGELTSIQARLVVSWPALPDADRVAITDPTQVRGYVESVVSFPAP